MGSGKRVECKKQDGTRDVDPIDALKAALKVDPEKLKNPAESNGDEAENEDVKK